jgi:hypothetical protein
MDINLVYHMVARTRVRYLCNRHDQGIQLVKVYPNLEPNAIVQQSATFQHRLIR